MQSTTQGTRLSQRHRRRTVTRTRDISTSSVYLGECQTVPEALCQLTSSYNAGLAAPELCLSAPDGDGRSVRAPLSRRSPTIPSAYILRYDADASPSDAAVRVQQMLSVHVRFCAVPRPPLTSHIAVCAHESLQRISEIWASTGFITRRTESVDFPKRLPLVLLRSRKKYELLPSVKEEVHRVRLHSLGGAVNSPAARDLFSFPFADACVRTARQMRIRGRVRSAWAANTLPGSFLELPGVYRVYLHVGHDKREPSNF
ncbi:unnamed protein product [Rangifer tarandus platyrhynchus]|uniref:Uncharacterized protein n=1 Tax=Rangifer tarandus platyrhynchus TaxID=3082113 RepID=A0ABN8XL75_RANTA|nr:unnamed protein product [Rangifer tarandus platyrhynchus]